MALKLRVSESRTFSKTIYLEGRLDNQTVGALDAELDKIASSSANVVIFDLAQLEYISSIGLRSIFAMHKVMAARSGQALLVNPQPQIKKVLEIVNAVDITTVFANTEELDRYLDVMQRRVVEGE